jgi:glycine oxidase
VGTAAGRGTRPIHHLPLSSLSDISSIDLKQNSPIPNPQSKIQNPTISIVGCGIIGATIAYELSCLNRFEIVVYDSHQPAQASTGAALGVLMGVISQKVKGRAWDTREYSIRRYDRLIPKLESITGLQIPHNSQGIFKLLSPEADLVKWQQLATTRQEQQWQLEIWESSRILAQLPQLNPQLVGTAIYSPQDLQVDPVALTNALIAAAKMNGVKFHFDRSVSSITASNPLSCDVLMGDGTVVATDRVIVTAGLGSTDLLAPFGSIEINPVLGQAIHFRLPRSLGNPDFQPTISYEDLNIVPLKNNEYWVGATVEFPVDGNAIARSECLEQLKQTSIDLCPELATGEILRTWQGLRPRPHQRPAPVIDRVGENGRVLVATGHYRNGILLAPATARSIVTMLDDRGL